MYVCIYNCYILIFHSVVPDVSATALNRAATQEGSLVLYLTHRNFFLIGSNWDGGIDDMIEISCA